VVAVGIHGVAPSPAAHAVIEQLMTPLRAALEGLDGRTRVELTAAAAAAAAHARLAHMKTGKVAAHVAAQVPSPRTIYLALSPRVSGASVSNSRERPGLWSVLTCGAGDVVSCR